MFNKSSIAINRFLHSPVLNPLPDGRKCVPLLYVIKVHYRLHGGLNNLLLITVINCSLSTKKVFQGRPGVIEQHAGTGVAHDGTYLFAHTGAVAMNGALLAGGFPFAVPAMRKACVSIL